MGCFEIIKKAIFCKAHVTLVEQLYDRNSIFFINAKKKKKQDRVNASLSSYSVRKQRLQVIFVMNNCNSLSLSLSGLYIHDKDVPTCHKIYQWHLWSDSNSLLRHYYTYQPGHCNNKLKEEWWNTPSELQNDINAGWTDEGGINNEQKSRHNNII